MSIRLFLLRAALAAWVSATTLGAVAQTKVQIHGADDLPRFVYPLSQPASALLLANEAQFEAFASHVQSDLEGIFADDEIADKATLRELLAVKVNLLELAHQPAEALIALDQLQALEEKPAARLTASLFGRARLKAAIETGQSSGPAYVAAFTRLYRADIEALPWDVVQDTIRAAYASTELTGQPVVIGRAQTLIDPVVARSGNLDNRSAWILVAMRDFLTFGLPLKEARAEVLRDTMAKHQARKPDIWPARDVTLRADQKLTPVAVAIWDSGIDLSLYPGQVFEDVQGTPSGHHGLAFDDQGGISTSWLHPLTEDEKKEYPLLINDIQGRFDIENGVQSKQAEQLEKEQASSSVAELHRRDELDLALGHYLHGTHCAGIAVRGNPYARLVVARFNDDLPYLDFVPTTAWAERMEQDFQQLSSLFRTRHVRVVNMSWGDDVAEFEQWLSRTGQGQDAADRKAKAVELFQIWHRAVENAIKNAPDTLFVTAAGNSDSDASFLGDVPSSLQLPNLISVGAVNQAGDETSFTSSGPTVLVHADGYHVESFVPGGARLPLSGTSMASPNVVNLAAKLFALDPTLTPAQVIKLIRAGSDVSSDGRIHLINPAQSVRLLKTSQTASAAAAPSGQAE